jgi:hypothetical protein
VCITLTQYSKLTQGDQDEFNGDNQHYWSANFFNTTQKQWDKQKEFLDEEKYKYDDEADDDEVYDVEVPVEKPAGEMVVYNPTKPYKFGGLTVDDSLYEHYEYNDVSDKDFAAMQSKLFGKPEAKKEDDKEKSTGHPQLVRKNKRKFSTIV